MPDTKLLIIVTAEQVSLVDYFPKLKEYFDTRLRYHFIPFKKKYDINVSIFRFFKDRHWLFTEFKEIIEPMSSSNDSTKKILEIGCGVGNSVFPIVEHCKDSNVFVYGCDFSENAVNILKEHEEYKPDRYCEV